MEHSARAGDLTGRVQELAQDFAALAEQDPSKLRADIEQREYERLLTEWARLQGAHQAFVAEMQADLA